ncbi:MAG TPA: hypothetical protein VFQ72_01265 [Candidatus Paceibacterota bacterium]|nr:hypothetical protein [Candidatus Paceibacterota bacterium]
MHKLSARTRALILTVIAVIAGLVVFQAGIFVGYHKALFSYRGGERYARLIEGPRGQFGPGRGQIHGATGRVVSVSLPSFVVVGPDGAEKTIVVASSTSVVRFREAVGQTAIRVDDDAFVLGDPDAGGSIQARFIRLMPVSAQ